MKEVWHPPLRDEMHNLDAELIGIVKCHILFIILSLRNERIT